MINIDLLFLIEDLFHKTFEIIVHLEPAGLVIYFLILRPSFEVSYVHFSSMGDCVVLLSSS